jgi:hypothetical protein
MISDRRPDTNGKVLVRRIGEHLFANGPSW